jgi:chromosome segregation ATPase
MDQSAAEKRHLQEQVEELTKPCTALQAENATATKQYDSLQLTNKAQATDLRRAKAVVKRLEEESLAQAAKLDLLVVEKELLGAVAKLEDSIQLKDAQVHRSRSKIDTLQAEYREISEKLTKVEEGWNTMKTIFEPV